MDDYFACKLTQWSRSSSWPHIASFQAVTASSLWVHACDVLNDLWVSLSYCTISEQTIWPRCVGTIAVCSSKIKLRDMQGSGTQLVSYIKREWPWARRNGAIDRLLWVYRAHWRSGYWQNPVTAAACLSKRSQWAGKFVQEQRRGPLVPLLLCVSERMAFCIVRFSLPRAESSHRNIYFFPSIHSALSVSLPRGRSCFSGKCSCLFSVQYWNVTDE